MKQLPQSNELRSAFERLSPQAKTRTENWLDQIDRIPNNDFNTIQLDREGGVFYVENIFPETAASNPDENYVPVIQEITIAEVFTLHSKPSASKVVHLDFDGHEITGTIWNNETGRSTLYATPYDTDSNEASFSTSEVNAMAAIWHRVAEDLAPFDIDVTTEPPLTGYSPNVGHILVTHRTDALGYNLYPNSAGGVAYVNVWGRSNYTYYQPALVFYNHLGNGNIHYTAEAASHELGHNLGLSHDGTSTESYYGGHGSGNIGWAPIMGVGYYQEVTQWSDGNYTDANNTQDDLNIIANKLGYSIDDHGNSISNATELDIELDGTVIVTNPENDPENNNISNKGIIETSSDLDFFTFSTTGGQVSLDIIPSWEAYNIGLHRGSNLDIKVTLYNILGITIETYNISTDTFANISINLSDGTYFISIEGEESSNYNQYGSIGQYFISGTIEGGYNTVPNEIPTASFTNVITDRTVNFTDTSLDNDGTIVSWSWDFGDGNFSSNQSPTHIYSADTNYTVSLTVTDDIGATDTINQTIAICLDTDNDGVCNDDDVCPGGDDTIDTDNDGTPDFCDSCNDLVDIDGDGVSDCIDQEINSPCPNNVDTVGVSLDSDNDGVCDDDDLCPGSDDTVDSDADGTPDGCDSCPNSATGDSDGDGICDDLDICPGGDDSIDTDGDGIPDFCDNSCVPNTASFSVSTLTHSGLGASNTSVVIPTNGQNVSFSISDFDQVTNGKPNNRFIEEVTVSYMNGLGNNITYGTFSSATTVSIAGLVQSVTVSLYDGYDGNAPNNFSVNLSVVDFCIESVPCDDSDADGVCDTEDQCPDFDDNLDSDNDGIPDGCDTCNDLVDTDNDGVRDCVDQEINSPCPNNVDSDGFSLDSDGDGVCDDDDICPGGDDSVDSDGDGIPDFCDSSDCNRETISFSSTVLTHSGLGASNTSVVIP
ncbi:MAG: PKD domain-containing protein, partial [Flavobacteriaceae bacterium]